MSWLDSFVYIVLGLSVFLGTFWKATRHSRAGLLPKETGLPWFATVVETLDKHTWDEVQDSLQNVARRRELRCFEQSDDLPGSHMARRIDALESLIAQLDYTTWYSRKDSHLALAVEDSSVPLARLVNASHVRVASILPISLLRDEDYQRQTGFARVELAQSGHLVRNLIDFNSLRVFEPEYRDASLNKDWFPRLNELKVDLMLELPDTVLASEFSPDHRYIVQVAGSRRIVLFYPENQRELVR